MALVCSGCLEEASEVELILMIFLICSFKEELDNLKEEAVVLLTHLDTNDDRRIF